MAGIHASAVVETEAIGDGVTVGEFAIVRSGAVLGDGAVIHPHAIIDTGVEVGAGTEILPRALLGRRPRAVGAVAREPVFEERLTVGEGCSIGVGATIYYDVEIGADTLIGDSAWIRERCRVGDGCVVGNGAALAVGVAMDDGAVVMFATSVTSHSRLGRDSFVAMHVVTTNDNTMGGEGWSEDALAGIAVEERGRVGANATLLPGVTIGVDAVVGAGSMVTRDVPTGVTVFGNPARPRTG